MIRFVKGDILLSEDKAVAHGVAPNDDFKQGLALSLRERWPSLYKDFRHYCKTTHPKEGGLWSWKSAESPFYVQLFTQQHPPAQGGKPGKAHTSYVQSSLRELVKFLESENISSVSITRLATGVGGLDWSEVKPLIEAAFKPYKGTLTVYEVFQAGKKPELL